MTKQVWVGICLCLVVCGCISPAPQLDVYVIGLTPLESTGLEQRIRVDLRLQNPTDTAISARGLQLALDVNGKPLARGVSNEPFSVPSLGETTTSIVTSTSVFDLVRQALGVGTTQTLDYQISGKVFRQSGFPGSVGFNRSGTLGELGGAKAAPRPN